MAKAVAVATPDENPNGMTRVTAGPERLLLFLKDVRQEMRKVITPARSEWQNTTVVVIVTVFIFAAYFALIDSILGRGIDKLFTYFTRH